MADKPENMPWSFRFHETLKAAIAQRVDETGEGRPEVVAKILCDGLGIAYVPVKAGRPWPEKKPAKKSAKATKPSKGTKKA